ncbi:MAG TPA: mevalonate kinase [Anaerolineaceae bacterium]
MPAISESAPGKTILFGEHAVVYKRPAIAVPVEQVRARVIITALPACNCQGVQLIAPEINLKTDLAILPVNHPLKAAIEYTLDALKINHLPSCVVKINSTIPVAAGLGSGAAVSVAIARAVSRFLGHPLSDDVVSDIAYNVDKLHHGTPSGVDNTVITYSRPIYFIREQPFEQITVSKPFEIVIGNTGIHSPTSETVSFVRSKWLANPADIEPIFDQIGQIVQAARKAIETGNPEQIGKLMDENHLCLQTLGVSSPELDQLVYTARRTGALGAKLCGGGKGGNMIALIEQGMGARIANALLNAGAVKVIQTTISAHA